MGYSELKEEKYVRIFYIVLGLLFLGLGCVGTVLPILPTTPLLLLAAFCFARSSERLNTWFKGTRLYKNNLESFAQGRGMTRKAKLRIMGTVTCIMLLAFGAMKNVPIGRICISVVWVAHVLAFCFAIRTCEEGGGIACDDQ